MIFNSPDEFLNAPRKCITAFGMSGVGKTHFANKLRDQNWFHYSVDYRIGTRYMGEHIVDNFKQCAMKDPFLANLLRTDSIFIGSNITFNNLSPLSTYLGKPGNPELGGIPFDEYKRRQAQHRQAEISAMLDTPYFIDRAKRLYGYDHFIADSSGSFCEVIDLDDPQDPVLEAVTGSSALLYIRGTEEDEEKLIARFKKAPKPMYYAPKLLDQKWQQYKKENKIDHDQDVDPDAFMIWVFSTALRHRLPLYQQIADQHGYVIEAADLATMRDMEDFDAMMAAAITNRNKA